MRGHIVKRYEDSYNIVIELGTDPATGKRRQQWVTVKGTKREAEKRLAELLHQLDSGTFTKPRKVTLSDFLEQWLQDYCRATLAPHTAQTYEFFVRQHIAPAIGQIPLTQLKPEQIQRLYSEKLSTGRRDGMGGLGGRSVRYIHTTLHKALKSAVKMGMIARNPADSVDIPTVKRHEMHTFNEDDLQRFLEAARKTGYYGLFYLALFTGMRRSELLALRWSDIDLLLC